MSLRVSETGWDRPESLDVDSGIEALRASPEFEGTVEVLGADHACNDHLALFYETREEQLDTIVPFIRQGLARGERCMYVTDEISEDELLSALRDGDVDVEAALESGALTFHTVDETYLRNDVFEPEGMVDFYAEAIAEATEEFSALRVIAETTWLQAETSTIEDFITYESKVNELFEGEDCVALCQYDRTAFEPEVVRDLLESHPHLIYDGTLCHNFYYTPPAEFFGPDRVEHEVDRMMGTLVDRTEARVALQDREQFLREAYRTTADTTSTFEEKVQGLLELGREWFDLDLGFLARTDRQADDLEIEAAVGPHELIQPGITGDLTETYCRAVLEADGPVTVHDAVAEGWADDPAFQTYGLESYVGTALVVDGDVYGTLCFGSRTARDRPFAGTTLTFLDLMAQWLEYELARRNRQRALRTLYEITADRETAFEEKIERLLSFGCERFGLDQGYLVNVHRDDEAVEIEQATGAPGEDLREGIPAAQPNAGQFCRRTIELDRPIGAADVREFGWEDDPVYEESGLRSYFGVTVTDGDGPFGTLAFCDTEPRDRAFTDAEYTFLELMGQWVSNELIRRRRETQLAALNEMSRTVTAAETRADIADHAVEHAAASLQLPVSAIVTYDGDSGELTTAASTPRAEDELPTAALCDRPDGQLWEAFVAGEVGRIGEVSEIDGSGDTLTEVLAVPLGRQGLFVVATAASGGFPDAELEFVETIAATVEAGFTRADREQQLHHREETLEAQNDALERLNRVNDIIRNIDQALVGAASRQEIERVVCEQLAEVGPYELAWIGTHETITQEVTPTEWAGAEEDYVAGLSVSTDHALESGNFVSRAVETRETQVIDDVLEDGAFEPWRQAALNRGHHACIGLPLVYGETLYGVLVVFAGQPGVFDDLERSVLTEMADTIAYAINAVESKKALVCDEVTRLSFDLDGANLPVVEVIRSHDYEVSLESLVPGSDGEVRAVVSTTGLEPAPVCQLSGDMPSVDDVTLVSEYDEPDEPFALYELRLTDRSLLGTALEHGGRPTEFAVGPDAATLTVELAADAAVREFVEMFRSRYPGVELVAQRTRKRRQQSTAEIFAGLTGRLTDRQLEALQLAYHTGYLEEPRLRSATELAEAMDISQPTFNSHLRAANRKLCEQLFEDR